jgi:hypothetical protein
MCFFRGIRLARMPGCLSPDVNRHKILCDHKWTPVLPTNDALAHLSRHSDHPDGISTAPRRSPQTLFRSRQPFKSHSVRRKRQRLPPSLLIENASDLGPAPPLQPAPRRFRSRLATIRWAGHSGSDSSFDYRFGKGHRNCRSQRGLGSCQDKVCRFG